MELVDSFKEDKNKKMIDLKFLFVEKKKFKRKAIPNEKKGFIYDP